MVCVLLPQWECPLHTPGSKSFLTVREDTWRIQFIHKNAEILVFVCWPNRSRNYPVSLAPPAHPPYLLHHSPPAPPLPHLPGSRSVPLQTLLFFPMWTKCYHLHAGPVSTSRLSANLLVISAWFVCFYILKFTSNCRFLSAWCSRGSFLSLHLT